MSGLGYSPNSSPSPRQPEAVATGQSGRKYQLFADPIGSTYRPIAGVYIFAYRTQNGGWTAVYIGETSNFRHRLTDELRLHHQWENVRAAGATHILTMAVDGNLAMREGIETDLRRAIPTPCNEQ